MLKLRPNCECCDKDLPADAADALICTFECTFCADCAANRLPGGRCPNCSGELVRRPVRPPAMLAKYPGVDGARAQAPQGLRCLQSFSSHDCIPAPVLGETGPTAVRWRPQSP